MVGTEAVSIATFCQERVTVGGGCAILGREAKLEARVASSVCHPLICCPIGVRDRLDWSFRQSSQLRAPVCEGVGELFILELRQALVAKSVEANGQAIPRKRGDRVGGQALRLRGARVGQESILKLMAGGKAQSRDRFPQRDQSSPALGCTEFIGEK